MSDNASIHRETELPFHSPLRDQRWDRACYTAAVRFAWVAGLFSLMVTLLLVADYLQREAKNPFESPAYLQLKAQLAQHPDDQAFRNRLRQLDLELRRRHFRHRRFAHWGAWLLLGGVLLTVASYKTATVLRRRLPMPEPQEAGEDPEAIFQRQTRWAVGTLALAIAIVALVLSWALRSRLPSGRLAEQWLAQQVATAHLSEAAGPGTTAGLSPITPTATGGGADSAVAATHPGERPGGQTPGLPAAPAGSYPTEEQIRKNWHRFRGPGGSGISAYENVPIKWDEQSGQGILWKTPVPLPGNNSPVVWEGRVFLSGATPEKQQVYCFDAETGELLWQGEVPIIAQRFDPDSVSEDTGYAAPTTATDGRRVFAIFATGDVAAFDFEGKLLWSRNLGVPDSAYGYAASLEVYRNLLLIQFDQGSTPKEGKSRLFALDAASGSTVYEVPRPVPNSWASPIVIHAAGRDQLITCGDPWVISYDPATGKEIWRAKCLSGDVGPSPSAFGDVVHVGNEYCIWSAIKADGHGDVTETHVLWTAEDNLPDTASPLVTDKYLLLAASWGMVTCFDTSNGQKLWELELDASFTSSPALAGKYVYQFGKVEQEDEQGNLKMTTTCWVIEPTDEEGKIIAENHLSEGCVTSPAFQDGRIYIRGSNHLYCLGER